ncbi:MAG: hypothetical protein H5U11_05340 [Rhizobium sp.]|uniref:hypothetical protein n=1 Tax=Ciceribacter sp. T2.26MG-112.2 TaxID=3137154 RepID=UPI0012B69428|nr:hypothetical protein [Ciceribacter naphthalenivorans]MBC7311900.1 hypothetical protein [Rhizobium sp.]
MTGKIVLHLGAHKTATTAIQEYCTLEANTLRADGIVYVGHTTKPFSTYRTLRDLTAEARGEGRFDSREARCKLVIENTRKIFSRGDIRSLLIPWEIFLGEPYDETKGILYPGARASLSALAEFLNDLPTLIVFTIRDQWDFLNSWYLQLHKLGHVPDPDHFRNWAATADLSWRPIVDTMRQHFGAANVMVLQYGSTAETHKEFFRALFSAYGYTGRIDPLSIPRRNESWPKEALEIARHVMPLLPNDRERYLLRLKLDDVFSGLAGRPVKVLDDEMRLKFSEKYANENALLTARP